MCNSVLHYLALFWVNACCVQVKIAINLDCIIRWPIVGIDPEVTLAKNKFSVRCYYNCEEQGEAATLFKHNSSLYL